MQPTPESSIPQAVYDDCASALKVAKITMMMQKDTAFYTAILMALKQVISEEIPTAAVDGRTMWINPKWFADLSPNERIGLLAHEVLHVALDHMHRRGNRDPDLWNHAGDYVINIALKDAGYALPAGLCEDQYRGMLTEQVYKLLEKKTPPQKKAMDTKAGPGGGDIAYPEDAKQNPVTQDEVTSTVLRATTQAKAMGQTPGSIPGEVGMELQKTLNPPLPWHIILRNFLTEFAKDDYSWRRPNKRFLPRYYLPIAHSEAIANIAIAVDTSCSVSDHEFNTFISKVAEIQETMQPKKITVISFDTKLGKVQELTASDNPFRKLKFKGRGGTAIHPVHQWAAENKPTVLLVFTDGQFRKTEPVDKSIPLVWLIHGDHNWQNDFGQVITYDITI